MPLVRKANVGLVIGLAVASALTAGCGSKDSSSASELVTVTIALPTGSPLANVAFIPVGVDRGYFKEKGVALKVNYLQGGTAVVSAVQAGQADLALTSPEPLVLANSKGGDLQSIYQVADRLIYQMGFLPGSRVKTWPDLPGAKIGVVSAGNMPTYLAYFNHELAARKLPPIKQSDLVAVGEGASATAAVKSGRIDALFLTDTGLATVQSAIPDLRVEKLTSFDQGFPSLALMARKSVVAKKAAALKDTLAAFAKATDYCVTNAEECMSTFAKVEPNAVPDRASTDAQWTARAPLYAKSADGRYGVNIEKSWQFVDELQKDAGLIDNPPPAAELFTNDLVSTD